MLCRCYMQLSTGRPQALAHACFAQHENCSGCYICCITGALGQDQISSLCTCYSHTCPRSPMVLRCCASKSSALYGMTTWEPAFANALMIYLARNPVDPKTVAVRPLTCEQQVAFVSTPARSVLLRCAQSSHLDIDLVVWLTDERPPGPALRPLFRRVIPAVSSVAKPRQTFPSPVRSKIIRTLEQHQ